MTFEDSLSIVVKTFLRPQCLCNFIESIVAFQNFYSVKFNEIVIIDDSDEESNRQNIEIINKYAKFVSIIYEHYPYNSLGASKGRNLGVKRASSKYILLCDDDYILDIQCNLMSCLSLFISNNIDYLGGFYKNINSKNSLKIKLSNWLGFYSSEKINILTIFTDVFPDFIPCTVIHNFFISKRITLINHPWNEEFITNEHNAYFIEAQEKGLQCYFTNKLFVKHLHLDNPKKSYDKKRKSFKIDPQNRKIFITVIEDNNILVDNNVTLSTYRKYILQNESQLISRVGSRITFNTKFFEATVKLNFLRKYKNLIFFMKKYLKILSKLPKYIFCRNRLKKILCQYPHVLTTQETLDRIITERCSIARFGDGELQLALGIGLGKKGAKNEYQIADLKLQKRLLEILQDTTQKKCLVALLPGRLLYDDERLSKYSLSYWEDFLLRFFPQLKHLFIHSIYANVLISRSTVFHENSIEFIKRIWKNKKVLFVYGENSQFCIEKKLFDNIECYETILGPRKSAFTDYDNILKKILSHDSDWLVLLALGPTATVLAYDLSKLGYQAIDIGHLPNCYWQWKGSGTTPEYDHSILQEIASKSDIYNKQ